MYYRSPNHLEPGSPLCQHSWRTNDERPWASYFATIDLIPLSYGPFMIDAQVQCGCDACVQIAVLSLLHGLVIVCGSVAVPGNQSVAPTTLSVNMHIDQAGHSGHAVTVNT